MTHVSIVIPAKNEEEGLKVLLPLLKSEYSEAEIIVVNDGSIDKTEQVCIENGVKVISHRYSMGNGAALKDGARSATGDIIVFMDADGQHSCENIKDLLEEFETGHDMVVGARSFESQANIGRWVGNKIYNRLASWMTGHRVRDLTSGCRVVNADKFREFLHLYPNGFSCPTTSTMAFFRAGYSVSYVRIKVEDREGDSHLHIIKDGIRFFLIIFKIGSLYSPLKIFFPISGVLFLTGLSYYLFTFFTQGRFTNMSAVLFMTSVMIFVLGLISEQITMLLYSKR